mgnify:FL=1
MPDTRRHRGPHPEDAALFAPEQWRYLQCAVRHLSWLLSGGYAWESALKLVGDRFRLNARQRLAVQRCACSDQSLRRRAASCLPWPAVAGQEVSIDGFNLLMTVEAALAGGVLLCGRDQCLRDMASVHGSYRKVTETMPALRAIGAFFSPAPPAHCTWWLDRPVSNSGRLSQLIVALAEAEGWPWQTQLVTDPDRELTQTQDLVVTADSVILDACCRWVNLAAAIVAAAAHQAWIVPLNDPAPPPSALAP